MSTRLYKFTTPQHGISDLQHRRLKISTVDDLNDPFDLSSVDTSNPVIEQAMRALTIHLRQTAGLLSFSRNWDNILLWSHYGASHTGLCLGFDVPDGNQRRKYDMDVRYQPNLLQVNRPEDVNLDLANRLLRTKHESWSYEEEVRIFVGLNDPPDKDGFRWCDFGPSLELREVIAGAQCSPDDLNRLADVLAPYGTAVKCSYAYMRKDAFLLVRHDFPPRWFTSLDKVGAGSSKIHMDSIDEMATKELPFFEERCRGIHDLAITVGNAIPRTASDDHFAFMALCFLDKQIEHIESILILLKEGSYRDATLVARSMIEGTGQLLYAAQDPQKRAKQWKDFAAVTSRRKLQKALNAGNASDATQQANVENLLKIQGPQFYTKKALDAAAKGKPLPDNPYWRNWTGMSYTDVLNEVKADKLLDFVYGPFSEWHHWSPEGFITSIKRVGDDQIHFVKPPLHVAAQSLTCAFQCLWQMANTVDHFVLKGKLSDPLQTLMQAYINDRPSKQAP